MSSADIIDTTDSSYKKSGDSNNNKEHDKENHNSDNAHFRTKERDAGMADLKRKFESSLDTIRTAVSHLLTEMGTHMESTHNVIGEYEQILETQQQEAQRLEEVNKSVLSAMNPFLGSK